MELNPTTLVIIGVYLLQGIELVFFPLPSEVSTYEIFAGNGKNDDAETVARFTSAAHFLIAVAGTALSVVTFFIPGAILVYPPVHQYLIPFNSLELPITFIAGLASMILGSLLTLVAVIQISRFKSANPTGTKIYQEGLYRYSRHPISLGLILIAVGFLLRLPSAGMLAGTVIFIINVMARVRWEEQVLRARHGKAIQRYYESAGRFWPKKLNK